MPTHAEKRAMPWSREQMFDLVADVKRYPEFLPWVIGARITKREDDKFWADLIVGFRMFREKFTSRVHLDRPHRVDVSYEQGPMKYLNNHWAFLDNPDGDGCIVDFYVDFEFKNKMFQKMAGAVFNEAVRRMVHSFEARARDLYGETGN